MARRKHDSDSDVAQFSREIQHLLKHPCDYPCGNAILPDEIHLYNLGFFVWHGRGSKSESLSYQSRVARQRLSNLIVLPN